jgi:hypothetical protein
MAVPACSWDLAGRLVSDARQNMSAILMKFDSFIVLLPSCDFDFIGLRLLLGFLK